MLDEANLSDTMQEEYVFFGGKRIVRWDVPTGHRHYYFTDHLGSASVLTSDQGVVQDESDYYPYGGEIQITNTYTNTYKFTGKERDAESGLDDFGARYYGSSLGRFMTADWAERPTAVPYAVFGDPQSLNLYTYVRNDPITRADANGHCAAGGGAFVDTGAPCEQAPDPMNAAKQGGAAQIQSNQQTLQNQPKPGEAYRGDPYSLKPEGSTPVGKNGAKIFTYQVVDPTGRAVKDVSVQEHVKVLAAENGKAIPNPNPVHYPTGQVRDEVGPAGPSGNEHTFLKTEQTFTAMKGGNTYEMSTKVNQYVKVTNGQVIVQTVVVVP